MRGTPRILRYICATRICKNAQVRTIRREGRLKTSEPSETARRAPTRGASDDDTVHAPWRHGEHVNKVSVGEPADGSPPKEPSNQGGLGKVEGLCFPIANVQSTPFSIPVSTDPRS